MVVVVKSWTSSYEGFLKPLQTITKKRQKLDVSTRKACPFILHSIFVYLRVALRPYKHVRKEWKKEIKKYFLLMLSLVSITTLLIFQKMILIVYFLQVLYSNFIVKWYQISRECYRVIVSYIVHVLGKKSLIQCY